MIKNREVTISAEQFIFLRSCEESLREINHIASSRKFIEFYYDKEFVGDYGWNHYIIPIYGESRIPLVWDEKQEKGEL